MENLVRLQWSKLFEPDDYNRPYLRFIFPDYAVFPFEGRYYRIDFEMDGTSVEFDQDTVEEVEMDWNPVRAGAVLSARPIRAVDDDTYRAYAVLFGSDKKRDAYGTYFDEDTRYYLDWWSTRPWLYHHALGGAKHREPLVRSGIQRIGQWKSTDVDDIGVFVEGELDEHHKYLDAIKQLLDDEQVLYPSSGTIDYVMRVGDDGHVEDWPIAEVSSTVAPAELRMQPISARGMQALRALEGVPEGRFTMGVLDDILGRKTKDVEGTEETEDVVETVDEGDVDEPEAEVEETEVEEEDVEELAEAVARHLNLGGDLEKLVDAIRSLDEAVSDVHGRLDNVEQVTAKLAEDEPERVRSLIKDKDWADKLWSARRSAEEVDKDDVEKIKQNNNPSPEEGGDVFSAVKMQ
jgi:hypothetical protein